MARKLLQRALPGDLEALAEGTIAAWMTPELVDKLWRGGVADLAADPPEGPPPQPAVAEACAGAALAEAASACVGNLNLGGCYHFTVIGFLLAFSFFDAFFVYRIIRILIFF